ncbi:MAG: crotonase/enoyl-CoA hydratase family protein [Acidimicrobiaceae bacterium]|nr:crotonase/enoyl-CoA hydratase family protein [Acidimicrobiaceae bacterium]MYA85458.1 crotonase/enoyl-CoA hydratase family protein [Acidimicrobiaceae bacterium]MYB86786.1 crotonase/enoyl-CoA hydratase family protein [Acidimicrobiaceae bacterium]MYH76690.1 crotonase/enoyl-CoA hydratase family protein [Acidimicrobiaceae bacterium]MYK75849.1 crotonase/enoyl-CoA hydratase family protein [Acidimicrobiaceae bacterium]
MGYQCFEVEESQGIAHVRLSRGDKANSMIPAFWSELPAIVDEISDAGRARVIVLSAEGRHFCSGMDLSVFSGDASLESESSEIGRRRANLRLSLLHLQRSFTALEEARMPVLAAIQGACVGGGVDLVTAADCRYATADAWFSIHEINIGMTADVGTLQRLPKLIPSGVAREYAYTGRRMPAERAHQLGLVNEVFDDQESMMDAVMATASEIASKSPLAIHGTKEAINYSRDHTVEDSLRHIALWQSGMFHPEDLEESFRANSEGRTTSYEDLGEIRRGL